MPSSRYVGFIRAIMIGREGLHRDVVLQCFSDSGAERPVSHLTTGNVSFDAVDGATAQLIADEAGERMAAVKEKATPVFVRSLQHLADIDVDAIFDASPFDDVHTREVSFAAHEPQIELPVWGRRKLCATFASIGCELYTVTRKVDGETTGPGRVLEKALGAQVTTRSWTTIEKILTAHEGELLSASR